METRTLTLRPRKDSEEVVEVEVMVPETAEEIAEVTGVTDPVDFLADLYVQKLQRALGMKLFPKLSTVTPLDPENEKAMAAAIKSVKLVVSKPMPKISSEAAQEKVWNDLRQQGVSEERIAELKQHHRDLIDELNGKKAKAGKK